MAGFVLTSTAFENGGLIPTLYTCDGQDVSPPLIWTEPSSGSRSLALVADDPDAPRGTFTHWLAWGIPPTAGALREGEAPPVEGRNDFGVIGWRGPCPPPGHGPHRYFFRLFALDRVLPLPQGADRAVVDRALVGSVLDVAELVGVYER